MIPFHPIFSKKHHKFHPTTCSSNQACRKWRDPTATIRSHCFFFLLEETTQGGRSANGIIDCETVGLFSQNRFINGRLRGFHFTARAFSTYMQAKIRNVLQSVVVLTICKGLYKRGGSPVLCHQSFSRIKGNLHFNKKITLNHRKQLLQSSQSKMFLKKAFVSERNNF